MQIDRITERADRQTLDGAAYAEALRAGAADLRRHAGEINDLNVFPIPDGDTGSNMLLTLMGGVNAIPSEPTDIGVVSRRVADGMLLAARGNSGVILSQLFDGMAEGLAGAVTADAALLGHAVDVGVAHAYRAVLQPTEGTILTVARMAADHAAGAETSTIEAYCEQFLQEARRTLEKTPDMLPVLKRAGVVDSGGAGLVCILEGIRRSLAGEEVSAEAEESLLVGVPASEGVDFDRFTEDSVLEYGYCTELLLRLQTAKTDPAAFEVECLTDHLQTIGDSVVAVKSGSVVKIHVHTMTPDKVLSFCQRYGEFLTVKIENMSLQHNSLPEKEEKAVFAVSAEKKRVGVVAVCTGEGVKEMFAERGADVIVDGGQSMNPSAEDFVNAFRRISAETIVVLPNNANVILAAKQAAALYTDADVRILESKTIGDGYAALSMMDPDVPTIDGLMADLTDAMAGVVTAEVSSCVRDAELGGYRLHKGDFIGVSGKEFVSADRDRMDTAYNTVARLASRGHYEICLVLRGRGVEAAEAEALSARLGTILPAGEVYVIDGLQEVYDYILILQ